MATKGSSKKKVYWDTCCFIHLIQQHQEHFPRLSEWHRRAESGELLIVISTLVIAEVSHLKELPSSKEEQAKLLHEHFQLPFYEVWEVDRDIAEDASALGRKHAGLQGADAVHLATAIAAGVKDVHTYDDKRLTKLDGVVGSPALKIHWPPPIPRQVEIADVAGTDGS